MYYYHPIIPLLLALAIQSTSADPIETFCSPNTTVSAANSTTAKLLLSALSAAANQSLFHNASVGPAHGLYLCRGDAPQSACKECVAAASADLLTRCPRGTRSAAIWYDACMIRYSNEGHHVDGDANFNATVSTDSGFNTSSFSAEYQRRANSVVATTAGTAATEAAFGGGGVNKFAAKMGDYEGVFSVRVAAQCTPDLTDEDCYDCLVKCIGKLPTCCNTEGVRVLFLSCNLGYEVRKLYVARAPAPALGVSEMKSTRPIRQILQIVAVAASVLILLMLLSSLWFCIYKKKTKQVYEEDVHDIIEVESLHLEFNIIRSATQNFAIDRKLGQGGFGPVYKGTLENGQDIAVKRLSVNSGQGVAEFKTEVVLVAKLQHRNLVKLLGFCISGKEKILVYEFLPNSSLDKILFDPTKRMSLNWETRFKIISGIAKGLLYLHEDSRLKIVHRDLKSSNILLDEAMNPKISDFGLAKLFGIDQTQDATSTIAGTYGYMAPEYIFTGRYSVKSDVYSFGIMVLEVISGQRNYMSRPRDDEALLQQAWRLWNESTALNLVDETLGDNFSREEVLKCIHISLLCIQENDARRPNMATVVAALGGQAIALSLPLPPRFCSATDSTSPEDASVCKTSDITELYAR